MQISFVLLSAAALFYVHVARGVDSDNCKATIDGAEVSLKLHDRYCSDDTTSKICTDTNGDGFGDSFTEHKCEPDSKCLKSPPSYNTLCRRIVRNSPDSSAPSGTDQSPPRKPDSPPAKPDSPPPSKPKKQEPTESAPPPKGDNKPTQADQAPQAAPADNKPETCKATINGQEQTLNTGDRYCSDDTTSRVCAYGEWFDFKCPDNSKCLKSPNSWAVLCRIVNRNLPQPDHPQDSDAAPAKAADKSPMRLRRETPVKLSAVQDNQVHVQNAPTVADKVETCTANINGQEQTLKTNDRYCLDDTTSRVCNYGEWIDFKCPDNSKCLKSPNAWQVLCRIVNRNPPQPDHPQDSDAAPVETKKSNPKPLRRETPVKANAVQDAPANVQDAPSATDKVETCKATINGQEQTLNTGDRYCSDDTTSRVCAYGELIDFKCPDNSKCLKSPNSWAVLCRIVNRNPPQPDHPQDSDAQADNTASKPKEVEHKKPRLSKRQLKK